MSSSVLIFCAGVLFSQTNKVPSVSAGPDLEADALAIEAPIAEVTVFSDRARVRRRAEVPLPAGITALRLPDLPGAALLPTLRVSAENAKILRVEAAPVERERISIAAVESALDELEKKTDRRLAIDAQIRVELEELSFLAELNPKPPVDEKHRLGKPIAPVAAETARLVLDFLGERRRSARTRVRELEEQRREVDEAMAQLRRTVALRDLGAFTSRSVRVLAIVETKGAVREKLALEYFIPGASWTPAYDLHYFSKESQVEISIYGLATQATGEAWNNVALALSTAIPGQGIDMPELLTWTLGEKTEFTPHPMPNQELAARPFAPPLPQVTEKERARAASIESLRQRLAELDQLAAASATPPAEGQAGGVSGGVVGGVVGGVMGGVGSGDARGAKNKPSVQTKTEAYRPQPKPSINFDSDTIEGDLTRPDGAEYAARIAPRDEPAPAPSVAMRASESLSVTSGSSSGSVESYAHTPLALFEPATNFGPHLTDPNLPAVIAGGLDYVYPAAARFSVPSTAERLRVPLSADRYPVSVYYEATPSLQANAFLKATVENKSERAILRGPVNIFVGNDFTGEGVLQTTGPGGKIELPLGADEDVRLLRKVMPSTKTEGVFSKHDITTYTTQIDVGNYKRRAIRILVLDQIPKSNHQDIEVKLVSASPQPKDPPNAEGLMRFDLSVGPGETKKITFSYTIERPANWQLQQY